MAIIRPFRGARPRPELAAQIAAPPYDVVDFEEAVEYVKDKPLSFLRVEKSEIELDKNLDPLDEKIFQNGAKNLRQLLEQGKMIQDGAPCFYLYQQTMGKHIQVGLVAGASVKEYQENLIKKHEHTRSDKEEERTRHVDQVGANTGPVFLTYRAVPEIDTVQHDICQRKATVDFVAEDGIRHVLWVISKEEEVSRIQTLFSKVPHLYVADGHHRSAAASRVQIARAKKNPKHTGQEAYNYFLTVIFPHDQMQIMEYNRVVLDLNDHTPDTLLEAIRTKFEISPAESPKPEQVKRYGMFLDGKWHRLTAKQGTFPANDPVESLDVAILQNNLLGPLLGIQNPRTDKRIQFVGGIRGFSELERRAKKFSGVAFCLFPTSIHQLMSVADADQVMPPKSTWFEPKLRSGMVVKLLDE